MNEFDHPALAASGFNTPPVADAGVPAPAVETPAHPVDPVRSAAGRLGGKKVHELAELGRRYEREHGLSPGRQRHKQLVQLGKKYEVEHGLRASPRRRNRPVDAWQEFLVALARVVKPTHRPAVEQMVAALRPVPRVVPAAPVAHSVEQAA